MATTLGPTLETERLILRPPLARDLDGVARFAADPEVMRHLGGAQPRGAAWRALAGLAGSWALHGFGMFSVVEKASGRWIGRLGPWRPEGWPGTEIAWGLVRPAWGKGYAFEGVVAATDWAVDVLGWADVVHTIAPGNAGSAALARRLGAVNRGPGVLPAPYADWPIEVWGQTADEWRTRRQGRAQVPPLGPHQPGR